MHKYHQYIITSSLASEHTSGCGFAFLSVLISLIPTHIHSKISLSLSLSLSLTRLAMLLESTRVCGFTMPRLMANPYISPTHHYTPSARHIYYHTQSHTILFVIHSLDL